MDNITGNISPTKNIQGTISSNQEITGDITYGNGGAVFPIYEGEYTVEPKVFEETILSTNSKVCVNDITIKEIPFYEASNLGGGMTIYIGNNVEIS